MVNNCHLGKNLVPIVIGVCKTWSGQIKPKKDTRSGQGICPGNTNGFNSRFFKAQFSIWFRIQNCSKYGSRFSPMPFKTGIKLVFSYFPNLNQC